MNVISHPPKSRRIITRDHYVGICAEASGVHGDKAPYCCAGILDLFEIWTNAKLLEIEQQEKTNKSLIVAGEPEQFKNGLWIWKSTEELAFRDLFGNFFVNGLYGENLVGKCLNWLTKKQFLLIRQNPILKFDNVPQYKFNTEIIQEAIDSWSAENQLVKFQEKPPRVKGKRTAPNQMAFTLENIDDDGDDGAPRAPITFLEKYIISFNTSKTVTPGQVALLNKKLKYTDPRTGEEEQLTLEEIFEKEELFGRYLEENTRDWIAARKTNKRSGIVSASTQMVIRTISDNLEIWHRWALKELGKKQAPKPETDIQF